MNFKNLGIIPVFHTYQSNRLESLADRLADRLRQPLRSPLAREMVVTRKATVWRGGWRCGWPTGWGCAPISVSSFPRFSLGNGAGGAALSAADFELR
jgi:hypothetical protein